MATLVLQMCLVLWLKCFELQAMLVLAQTTLVVLQMILMLAQTILVVLLMASVLLWMGLVVQLIFLRCCQRLWCWHTRCQRLWCWHTRMLLMFLVLIPMPVVLEQRVVCCAADGIGAEDKSDAASNDFSAAVDVFVVAEHNDDAAAANDFGAAANDFGATVFG